MFSAQNQERQLPRLPPGFRSHLLTQTKNQGHRHRRFRDGEH